MFGLAVCPLLVHSVARAQTDEIQVYDGGLAEPGVFNITLHNNYTFQGESVPAFPGAIVPEHSLNGVAEWAYGVNSWFEAGLYLPLYSLTSDGQLHFNGFKLRTLFAVPHADERRFFYGVNFEFSYNQPHWDQNRYTQEIRPILGWHLGQWDLVLNPILDSNGHGFGGLDFAPAARVAYNVNKVWAVAVEEFADFGEIRGFLPGNAQAHQLFAVADYRGKPWKVEAGVGVGLTSASDKLAVKLIVSRDLNVVGDRRK